MRINQQGFGLIPVLVVMAVLGIAGFAGYRVMQNQKDKDAPQAPAPTSNQKSADSSKKEAVWKKGDYAIKGTYADADVIKINDDTWRLYYATQPEVQGHNFEVYSATSTDGKSWNQEAGVRKTMATFPDVVKTSDGKFRMYYQNAGEIRSAISTDGLTFTDETGTRIDRSNDAGLVFDNVAAPSVLRLGDGTYMMVYRGTVNERYAQNTPNPTTQLLMWATSSDGLTFTKNGIAIDSRNETLAGQLDGPDLVEWESGKLKMFSTTYAGVYSFDYDGKKFGEGTLAYAGNAKRDSMGFQGQPPGDPTLAKVSGTWYMYYGQTGAESGIHYAYAVNEN